MTHANRIRGADAVARSLARAGVRYLFTLSGNQIMPLFDACVDQPVGLIHVRHEAAAVHMADAWGRLTGEVGVALLTAGPGHANGISALYTALAAESPMVLLSGHAPLSQLGRGAFQEMPQTELARGVVKASSLVTDANDLGDAVERALRSALEGRPGPVHLSLPFDVLQARIDDAPDGDRRPRVPATLPLDEEHAVALLDQLRAARRPLIITGPMFCRAHMAPLKSRLEQMSGVPVVGMESPRGIDDPLLGAFAELLAQADFILFLGKPVDFALRFAAPPAVDPGCRFAHVDPDPAMLKRSREILGDRLVLAATADASSAAATLVGIAGDAKPADDGWAKEVAGAIAYRPPRWLTLKSETKGMLHPVEICRAVQPLLDASPDAVLIADGGEFGQWAQSALSASRRVINGPAGAIGGALPFALGARLACPEAPIVSLMGDGTVGFHFSEFDTAVRYRLPFVAVVGNDARWNAEAQIQLRNYGADRSIGCDLLPTRYDRAADAFGAHGEHVTGARSLPAALRRAAGSGLPACVNVTLEGAPAPVVRRASAATAGE